MTIFYPLSHFGFLRVSGVDAVSFMQGYTTCNLEALVPGKVQMGAICNLQGRMLCSFLVIRDDQDLVFRLTRAQVQPCIEFLSKYIVFSKATLADWSENLVCYGSLETVITDDEVSADDCYVDEKGIHVLLGNRQEHWLHEEPDAGIATDALAFIDAEIKEGIAWVNESSADRYLPQMFNYHEKGAIDFEKGCYLGQEIVARTQYRGELKRKLHRLDQPLAVQEIEGGEVIASGSNESLAVITNKTSEPLDIDVNGISVSATPLG